MNRFHFIVLSLLAGVRIAHAEIQPAADAPQPMSPEASMACMKLPPGFEIDLIASEPLIEEPSGVCWDEHGRLFVCELHGYNIEGHIDTEALNKSGELDTTVRRIRWEIQGGEIADKAAEQQWGVLKLLTDSDGDGVMDHAEVWADDLPPCYGIEAVNGGVIVSCAPDIVFFADRDGDGKPEIRETLYTGFEIHVLERGINNPRMGLDNWIYVGSGGDGGTITGPRLKKPVKLGSSDFRIKADGTAVEPVTGSVSTFGMTMNSIGDRFPSSGGRPAIYALPINYHYLKQNPYVPTPSGNHTASPYDNGYRISEPHPWRVKRGQDPEWVKFYGKHETTSIYFSGGCSTTFYGDALFPDSYAGNLFYCEPSLNIVHRCLLKREGAGYRAERAPEEQQSEFLASTDQWFRPMALRVSPEGALYIVDMYREIIEDYSAIPRFLQQQYGLDKGKAHGRLWRLYPAGAAPVRKHDVAKTSADALVPLLDHGSAWYRQTAQRLLVERRARDQEAALESMLQNKRTTPMGLIHTLYTLHGLGSLSNQHVRRLLSHDDYRVRVHALRLVDPGGWKSRSDYRSFAARVVNRVHEDEDPSVRIQAALTVGSFRDEFFARMLPPAAKPDEPWLTSAILSGANHESARALLRVAIEQPSALDLVKGLATTVASREDDVSSVLERVREADRATAEAVLSGFARAKRPLVISGEGADHLRTLATTSVAEVQDLALELALNVPDMKLDTLFARVISEIQDETRPLETREKAFERLAHAPLDQLVTTAKSFLNAKVAPGLQAAAVRALGKSSEPLVGRVLMDQWTSVGPKARTLVLATMLEQSNRLPALMDAIRQGRVKARDLTEVQREQLLKNDATASKLLTELEGDEELAERLKQYREALTGPVDLQQGEALFRQTCLVCHRLGAEGTDIGPALGSLITKPDGSILTDILDPAGKVDPEYTLYLVTLTRGETLAGVIASESPTSLSLKQADGTSKTVLRRDIATMASADVSLMPANLHEVIAPEAMPSVIAFIRKAYGEQVK